MGRKNKLLLILLFILPVLFWIFKKEVLRPPKMVLTWNGHSRTFSLNTDKNLSPSGNIPEVGEKLPGGESVILENGKFKITQGGSNLWESPKDWYVTGFAISDVTRDDLPDITLSVWKKGNFGFDKPFWLPENDERERNHFFIFQFENKTLKPIWQSSNLEAPNCEFAVTDVDGDDKNELVVIEGEYTSERKCQGKYLAVWKWNGWGFSNEWRSEKGNFGNLIVLEINGKRQVTVDMFSTY